MTQRILFVDDDTALLSTVQRTLGLDYELVTAASGAEALEQLNSAGPFAVVMTDMRMPQMDGIELIERARETAPEAIYLMLTGNQDTDTALRAVNEGAVFRFLRKPCEIAEVKQALDAALRQCELVRAEKELLQQTFVGAVKVMTDVIQTLSPHVLHQSQQVDEVMKRCEKTLGFTGSWEYRVAAQLGLLGLVLLPGEQQTRFQQSLPNDPDNERLLKKTTDTSARLVERIPRLSRVAEILRAVPDVDGTALRSPPATTGDALPATLLRIALHWAMMIENETPTTVALGRLRRVIPGLSRELEAALRSLAPEPVEHAWVEVGVDRLREGMVLFEDASTESGAVLLRKGRQLVGAEIEKLRLHRRESGGLKPLKIYKTPP